MTQPRLARYVALWLLGLLVSCGGAEQDVLNKFFTATRNGDTNTVAGVSLVAFPGPSVVTWDVVRVDPTTHEPFPLTRLREEAAKAKKARDEQFSRFADFRTAHYGDLLKIQDRLDEDPDASFTGAQAKLRAEWDAYREERRTLEFQLRDLEKAMEEARKPARESVMTSEDIDGFDGEVLTREVLVNVETEAGAQPYRFILRKYNLTDRKKFTPPSRWIITAIRPEQT
jgi:hypothetical protein